MSKSISVSERAAEIANARSKGTPVIAISCQDPQEVVMELSKAFTSDWQKYGNEGTYQTVRWDYPRGLFANGQWDDATSECPMEAVRDLEPRSAVSDGGVAFFLGVDDWINEKGVAQAIWNLRDPFKTSGRTLVLIGSVVQLPQSLQDVAVFDWPLPSGDDYRDTAEALVKSTGAEVSEEEIATTVEAVSGLTLFGAEQAIAMSFRRDLADKVVLDVDSVWDRKRQQVNQARGIQICEGPQKLDDLGGLGAIKEFSRLILNGRFRPNAIVFIDEIEKAMGGAGNDDHSTSKDQLKVLLTEFQRMNSVGRCGGFILAGPPGTGKTALATAIGNEGGILTLSLDLGDLLGAHVGDSQSMIRSAFRTLSSVSRDKVLFIATSNNLATIPNELKRRFRKGTWFVDLPDATEAASIWDLYEKRIVAEGYDGKVGKSHRPRCLDWSGAEIEQACDLAFEFGISLKAASEWIVPYCESASEQLAALRRTANGVYNSASRKGKYQMGARSDEKQVQAISV